MKATVNLTVDKWTDSFGAFVPIYSIIYVRERVGKFYQVLSDCSMLASMNSLSTLDYYEFNTGGGGSYTAGDGIDITANVIINTDKGSDVDLSSYINNPMTTKGDIIYGDTSGTPKRLGKGTLGQVLTQDTDIPKWANPKGSGIGDYVWISSNALEGLSYIDLTLDTAKYKNFVIILEGVSGSTTAQGLFLRLIKDGTLQDGASDYIYTSNIQQVRSDNFASNGFLGTYATNLYQLSSVGKNDSTDRENICGEVFLYNPANTTNYKRIKSIIIENAYSSSYSRHNGNVNFGSWKKNDYYTGFRIFLSAGTFEAGTLYLYGIYG